MFLICFEYADIVLMFDFKQLMDNKLIYKLICLMCFEFADIWWKTDFCGARQA